MRNQLIWVLVLYLPFSSKAQSIQSIFNTGGGSFQQGRITLEWSIGEAPLIENMYAANSSGSISNGLLQPYILAPNNQVFDNLEVRVLPNPTYGKLEVRLLTFSKGVVNIALHDAQGRILLSRRTISYGVGSVERFDLSRFAAGTYFMKIDLKPEEGYTPKSGTFKIVKL
jgi:hypothetical protein